MHEEQADRGYKSDSEDKSDLKKNQPEIQAKSKTKNHA
jgi:hypothetical protein